MPPECFAPFIVPFRGEASDTDESRNTSNTSTTDDSRNTSVNAQITQANPFFVPDEYVAALDLKVKAVASLRKRYVLHFPNPSDCLAMQSDTFLKNSKACATRIWTTPRKKNCKPPSSPISRRGCLRRGRCGRCMSWRG